jgi:hypothetical protein
MSPDAPQPGMKRIMLSEWDKFHTSARSANAIDRRGA